MSKLTKKFATVSVTVATVASLAGLGIAPVGAVTIAELQAQIAALTAQLASMSGGSTTCYAWTRSLTTDLSGADVTALQNYLIGTGHFTFSGGATGFFGSVTQAAVAAWQTANGVAPAAGYWGPLSQAMYATMCGDAAPDADEDEESTDLEGGAGSVDYTVMSGLTNEQVGEDEEDVEVAGLKVEAGGSDIELTAVRLVFDEGTAGADFEDYAAEVSVWLDGEEVGRVDGDQFNDANEFTDTITLDGAVVDEDDTAELVVAVSGINNLDTNDAGDTWTVDFRSVRFRDAQGSSVSEDPATATRTFSFESFATSADSKLDLRLTTGTNADKINKAHLINTHATDENELKGVPLLEFTMEAEGDSDLEVRDFGVDLVVTGAGDVDDIIAGGTVATTGGAPEVFLEINGERYGSAGYNEAAANNREIAFTDVDYTIPAGDTVTARILANLAALDTDADAGDTILAQILETQTDDTALVDVRDDSATQIVDADMVGEPTGIASTLRDTGFDLEFVSASAVVSHAGDVANTLDHDQGTFKIVFSLEAWDNNDTAIFLDEDAPMETGGTTSVLVTVTGTDTYVTSSIERTSGSASVESADTWQILAGDNVQFTVTYVTAAGADGLFRVTLEDIQYAVTDIDGNLSVLDAQIELTDSFKTPELSLNFDA
ncbi:MAG: peptidoglycan-binding domain-containing protein [Patescibacteria group bacterium]